MRRRVVSSTSSRIRHTVIGRPSESSSGSSTGVSRVSRTYTQAQDNVRRREATTLRKELLHGLTNSQQKEFEKLHAGSGQANASVSSQRDEASWFDEDDDWSSAPTNEDTLDELLHGSAHSGGRRRGKRSWEQRGRNESANWAMQNDRIAAAFFHERYSTTSVPDAAAMPKDQPELPFTVTVFTIDIFERSVQEFTSCAGEVYPNETLIRHGYLGTSPLLPTTAISLRCLRLYRAMRSRCSAYGMETFVRTLADLQRVHSQSHHIDQFSRAFVIFDDLELRLAKDLDKVLGRTDPHWRPKNNCPACSYELVDETPLKPRKMFSMDGNNSLKRLLKGGNTNHGSYSPSYFLAPSVVNSFADEVIRVRPPSPPLELAAEVIDEDIISDHIPAQPSIGVGPTDGELLTSTCASNWRAAQAQHDKKTPSIFDETGVFLACCRHGLVAVIVDMVRSGELAKYPMAVFSNLVDMHGDDLVIAYDIACSFFKTLKRSMTLSRILESSRTRMIVPAFHAYAHNRLCQLAWHPVWQPELGLEDFEWCERVFSSSNAVARCTRHASKSMRLRLIELHFRRWDHDRGASIGRFLYHNYMQALSVIREYTAQLCSLPLDSQVADNEVEALVQAELRYIADLKTEPAREVRSVEYVAQLQALDIAEQNFEKAWGVSSSVVAGRDADYAGVAPGDIMRQRCLTQRRQTRLTEVVERLEAELDIHNRWTPSMPEYIKFAKYARERKYRIAVDRLESILVQRLLELSRLNVAGVGYKLRRNISNALKTRSRAIRTAVTRVNLLAAGLSLEQPPIVFEDVLRHQFLAEFDLLRICRKDVRQERWAQASVRVAVEARLRIRRALEECTRVEVEARRLMTYMVDEQDQLYQVISQLQSVGQSARALQVQCFAEERASSNHQNRVWLDKLFSHSDFDGKACLGFPKNGYPVPSAGEPVRVDVLSPPVPSLLLPQEQLLDDESEVDEDGEFSLSEFVSNLDS